MSSYRPGPEGRHMQPKPLFPSSTGSTDLEMPIQPKKARKSLFQEGSTVANKKLPSNLINQIRQKKYELDQLRKLGNLSSHAGTSSSETTPIDILSDTEEVPQEKDLRPVSEIPLPYRTVFSSSFQFFNKIQA